MQRADTAGAVDPDEELLRHAARLAGVAVRFNMAARRKQRPHIELYERGAPAVQLGVFTCAAGAVGWLKGRPQQLRPDAAKRFQTAAARAALGGFELTRVADGFVMSRWNLSKPLADLDAVEAFLNHVSSAR